MWSKTAVFGWFFSSSSSKPWWSSTKPLNLGSGVKYWPPNTHGYPRGGGVVFGKDLGQLESRSVSVQKYVVSATQQHNRMKKMLCNNFQLPYVRKCSFFHHSCVILASKLKFGFRIHKSKKYFSGIKGLLYDYICPLLLFNATFWSIHLNQYTIRRTSQEPTPANLLCTPTASCYRKWEKSKVLVYLI